MDGMPAEYGDIDWDGLTRARRALLLNPFTVPSEELAHGDSWFAFHHVFLPRAMLGLCQVGRQQDARKLLLAAVHAFARAGAARERMKSVREAVEWSREKGLRVAENEVEVLGATLERFQKTIRRLLGVSSAIKELKREVWTLCFGQHLYDTFEKNWALRRLNVLILGETGTGKELVADVLQSAVLSASPPPSIAINCAALPRELAETELFGFEKGAHSTAHGPREVSAA